jgi:hypothetical protein
MAADAFWRLPPSAEVFSGDGRFTAGHVCLLEHLGGQLERLILLDRAGSEGQDRETGMVRRLLAWSMSCHPASSRPLMSSFRSASPIRLSCRNIHSAPGRGAANPA